MRVVDITHLQQPADVLHFRAQGCQAEVSGETRYLDLSQVGNLVWIFLLLLLLFVLLFLKSPVPGDTVWSKKTPNKQQNKQTCVHPVCSGPEITVKLAPSLLLSISLHVTHSALILRAQPSLLTKSKFSTQLWDQQR